MADLASFRTGFGNELTDPRVKNALFGLTHAEVGGQGPQAQQAFMETVFNRAAARNKSLYDTINDRAYFPAITHQRAARGAPANMADHYSGLLDQVAGGSNVSNYATGNASGTVGFAGGPQTYAANGERFGVEGPDRKWVESIAGGAPTPYNPQPSQQQQAQPMPSLSYQPTPEPSGNFFDRLGDTMQSPLFMMGAGVMSGPTIGAGLISGADAAQKGAQAKLIQQELMRKRAQEQNRDAMWQGLFQSGGQAQEMLKGYPAATAQIAYALGPDKGSDMIGKMVASRGDQQFNLDRMKEELKLKRESELQLQKDKLAAIDDAIVPFGVPQAGRGQPPQQSPMPQATPRMSGFSAPAMPMVPLQPQNQSVQPGGFDPVRLMKLEASGVVPPGAGKVITENPAYVTQQRAAVAQGLGLQPGTPQYREYVATGSFPKVEKNYPAILKADETVANIDNTLDTGQHALDLNKKAYAAEDWAPGLRSTVGGWFGAQGAIDTQKYEAAAKMLSQELAKSVSGSKGPSVFEQQLQAKLQGGIDKTRDAREDAIKQALKHIAHKRELAARQAEELRNGTYYNSTQSSQPAASSNGWSMQKE